MFIAITDGFVINLRDFDTMGISETRKKVKHKISGGFLGMFPEYEDREERDKWTLNIKYTKPDGEQSVYVMSSPNREELTSAAQNVFKQIRAYDPSMINKAFEEVFFKDETP